MDALGATNRLIVFSLIFTLVFTLTLTPNPVRSSQTIHPSPFPSSCATQPVRPPSAYPAPLAGVRRAAFFPLWPPPSRSRPPAPVRPRQHCTSERRPPRAPSSAPQLPSAALHHLRRLRAGAGPDCGGAMHARLDGIHAGLRRLRACGLEWVERSERRRKMAGGQGGRTTACLL